MSDFITDDFLLSTNASRRLYHEYASELPIIDYHNHLSPKDISEDRQFENISQIWLAGDHYKWRAMRANGVDEYFITGHATDWEKFEKWAETVPYTIRNPLYHWTHLELIRYFGISDILSLDTAREIYDQCSELLKSKEYSTQSLLKKMNVEVLCTTDDPTDKLKYHQNINDNKIGIKVLPAFRPDKLLNPITADELMDYIDKIADAVGSPIKSLDQLLEALEHRIQYFSLNGCKLSDHGLNNIPTSKYSYDEVANEFIGWRNDRRKVKKKAHKRFASLLIIELAKMYHKEEWTQQFHLGAIRNNNSRMMASLGADTGCDSIGDFDQTQSLSTFLDTLDKGNKLARTVLYNLNPRDNEVFATMAGNFQDGSTPGKIQWGSAWWFLDQRDGMTKQINTLSNMGLLSKFIGMLTDSRSFLSFTRHEYFRRILCNIIGQDVDKGLLPNDITWFGKIVQDISYYNVKNYLKL